jgi:hypothetical protein
MDDVAVSTAGTDSQDRPAGDAREAEAPRVVEVKGGRAQRSLRELALDAVAVVGLAGLAMTQPVLDLFGKSPTFFVAGNYGRRQIVAFALVVAVVPALTVWIVTALAGLAHRRAGVVLHRLGVVMLGGLFGLVLARSWGLDRMVMAFALAGAVGLGVAWAEWRWRPARKAASSGFCGGRSSSSVPSRRSSELTWSLDDRESLDDPASADGRVPVLMTGTVHGTDERPSDLVVALDGTIAGTIGGYVADGGAWTFSGILGPPGARGAGEEVVAYEVERSPEGLVLHPVPEG